MNIITKHDQLRDDMITLCIKHNLIGFAGTFRDVGETVTLWLEAPGYRDGFCKALATQIGALLDKNGAETTSEREGVCKPPKSYDSK